MCIFAFKVLLLSVEFSREEYWSELPFLSPGYLPNPRIEPVFRVLASRFFTIEPPVFNLYAEYIMRNAGLEEAQAGIKIARRNINNLRYADDTILMAESKELRAS